MTDLERIAELERLVALLLKERGGEKLVAYRASRREFTPPVLSKEQIILNPSQVVDIVTKTEKLKPRPLKCGKYAVTARALEDEAHQEFHNLLSSCDQRIVEDSEWDDVP